MTRPNWDVKLGKAVSRALQDLPPPALTAADRDAILGQVDGLIASSLEPISQQLDELGRRVSQLESLLKGSDKRPPSKSKSSAD
jgi:hypothetical protein